jgi:3-oxoacyl-[acyl-carrier-protein] synthase III
MNLLLWELKAKIAQINACDSANTNIISVPYVFTSLNGIRLETDSKQEDLTKIEELESIIKDLKHEKEDFDKYMEGSEIFENKVAKTKEIYESNSLKWENFARACLAELTPKKKEKIREKILEMQNHIQKHNSKVRGLL